MAEKMIKWADFSKYGMLFKVSSTIHNGERINYLIFGKDKNNQDNFNKEVFEKVGATLECSPIERNGETFFVSAQNNKLNLRELVQKLRNNDINGIKPCEKPENEVYLDLSKNKNERSNNQKNKTNNSPKVSQKKPKPKNKESEIDLNANKEEILQKSFIVGKNRLGKQIREINNIEGLNGIRILIEEQDNVIKHLKREPTELNNTSGSFLRAYDEITLNQCADAFLNEINNGEVKRYDDLENFARVIYSEYDDSDKNLKIEGLYNAIENSIGRLIKRKNTDLKSRELFELTEKIEENANYKTVFAKTKISNNIIDIPSPVSIAIHEIATTNFISKDKNVTVVNPGSGTLFSKFSRGTNLEIYDNRESSLKGLRYSAKELGLKDDNLIKIDKPKFEESDLIIMNVESDWLNENYEFSGETFTRKEFKEIIETLESKKLETSAFFSFKQPQDPDVIDEYKRFLELIGRKYAIQGIANIQSSLHSGILNEDNLMVLSIAENRPHILDEAPDIVLREKEISSYPEVWTWCTETIRANKQITNEHLEYDEEEENKSDKERNYFQVPYVSASRLGQAETMVPKHLEEPTKSALSRMAKKFGDVDERVAVEVGFSKKHLSKVLAPEQIDAIALETHAEERNKKGFLLGDMTGIGKGRTLAAMALRQINSGKNVVFLTQKDSNIRDLFRDFSDLGVSTKDFNFTIFNNNTSFDVEDPELGEITVKNDSPEELMEMIRLRQPSYDDEGNPVYDEDGNIQYENHYRWPERENGEPINIIFATYSQFSKALDKCKSEIDRTKIGFINNAIDENTALILDECQSAAGQSNTGRNMKSAVDAAGLVRYSSATHLKRASSTPVFNPLFPEHMSEEEVKDIMEKGGENIQEVVSSMLARDGVFLRREHDNSALEYDTVRDVKNEDRNKQFVDYLSPILSELCYLSGDVNRRIQNDIEQQVQRMERLEMQREENLLNLNREEARQNRRQINNLKGVIKSMQGSKLSLIVLSY
jgi:flagellar motor switch/type III secretory pathway protein FliN